MSAARNDDACFQSLVDSAECVAVCANPYFHSQDFSFRVNRNFSMVSCQLSFVSMITSKTISDDLMRSVRRPPVPQKLGTLAIMQVDLENYTAQARPGDPIQNGEASVLRLFGVTDNVCLSIPFHVIRDVGQFNSLSCAWVLCIPVLSPAGSFGGL